MALNDAEVLHWLRESDCEDMLREVPGTELLSLLAHSRYNPSDETSQLAFMAGLERHQEAAFAQLQAQSPARPVVWKTRLSRFTRWRSPGCKA
jgi:hypothetical protein